MPFPSRPSSITCCLLIVLALVARILSLAPHHAGTAAQRPQAGSPKVSMQAVSAPEPQKLVPDLPAANASPRITITSAVSPSAVPQPHSPIPEAPATLPAATLPATRVALDTFAGLPIAFEKNAGQTNPRVKFLSRGTGYTLFLAQEETVLAMRQRAESTACGGGSFGDGAWRGSPRSASSCAAKAAAGEQATQQVKEMGYALSMKLVGANRDVAIEGLEQLPGHNNYLIGNDPTKWHTNVPTYAKVHYRGIYPGVDLVYYGNQRALEYDFVLAPGADTRAIQLDVHGADKMHLDAAGDLVLPTSVGDIFLKKPEIYQQVGEEKREIAGNYAIHDGHLVTIELGAYDHARELVIDPTLLVSTYLGGSTNFGDFGHNVALDLQQAIYIAGQTGSTDFPTTTGSFQPKSSGSTTPGLSTTQPFITKIKADGSALVYSTFVTGTDNSGSLDFASGLGVDASGSAFITGATNATDFPLVNPVQSSIGGARGQGCAFLSKLTPDGSGLMLSTYFCGRDAGDNSQGLALALDSSGNPIIAGFTNSVHFPLLNPLQSTLNGTQNAFVAKFTGTGTNTGALVFSTYVGGNGTDQAHAVAVDANGNAYITGFTTSTNFPTMNPFEAALAPGVNMGTTAFQNAFISEIKSDGSALLYSTYLGGDNRFFASQGGEAGFGIAAVSPGKVVVVGQTNSSNFPTANPIQAAFGGGNLDAFVTEITTDGMPPVFSTYVGGSGDDFLLGVALDATGNIYFSGGTSSTDLTTVNPLQATLAGQADVLIGRINAPGPTGSAFDYLTYIGLSDFSNAVGIAVDNANPVNTYITGTTNSPSFPTVNPLQPNLLTGVDFQGKQVSTAFVAKISSAPGTGVTFFPPNGNFGSINVASTEIGPGTITNNSSGPITILSYGFTGSNASDFAQSSLGTNTCVTGTPLPMGQGCVQHFSFTPGAEGTRTATLTVTLNSAGANQTISVPLTGMGVIPAVSINPTSVDFGNVGLGDIHSGQVFITNEGGGPLTVGNVHLIGPNASSFTASPFGCAPVAPGQSCLVSLQFQPLAATPAPMTATLEIDDNAPGSPQMVPLSGTGVSQITFSPSPVPFQTTAVSSTTGSFGVATLNNGTASQLVLSTVAITGPNAGDFSLSTQPIGGEQCQAGAVVPALGASCEALLVFTPTGAGTRTATLTITDNGTGSPRSVTLSGVGANTVQTIPANTFDFGGVILGNQRLESLALFDYAATPVTATGFAITGPNAADFAVNGSPACQAAANGGFCSVNFSFIPTVIGAETATLTISYTGAPGSPITLTLQGTGAPNVGPGLFGIFLEPGSIDFGGQLLMVTSDPPMVVNFFNSSPAPVTVGTISIAGTNPTDFAIVSSPNDCTAAEVLGAGATCAIHLTFTAGAMGLRSATLSVSFSGPTGSPVSVPVSGMGVPPAIMVSDTVVDFGDQPVGSQSAAQSVFLINGNMPAITLGNPVVTLTPSSGSAFTITPTTGQCNNSAMLAGSGGSCSATTFFRPTTPGPQTATLTFTDSDPGSPRTVILKGNGTTTPGFGPFSPNPVNFNNQTVGTTSVPMTVTLNVTAGSSVTLASANSVFLAGPNAADFAVTSGTTCVDGATVTTSCIVNLSFAPGALGLRTAALTVITNNPTLPVQSVMLTGTGVNPVITVSPTTLNYGNVLLGTSNNTAPQPVMVVNGTPAGITIISLSISGPNMADFTLSSGDCQPGQALAVSGGTCTINPTFSPKVNGPETATLTVTVNAPNLPAPPPPFTVTLNATGVSQITLNPTALNFGNVSLAAASPRSLTLTVTNNTANRLLIPNNSDSITGPNMPDFTITSDTCSTPAGTPPLVLPTGGVCSVTVTFTLGGSGNRSATLNIGAGGTSPLPVTVPLSGTGTAPVVSLNPTSLSFGSQTVSTTSTALPVTITNTGNDTLALVGFAFSGTASLDYAVDPTSTCHFPNGTLAPATICVLSLNFTPATTGSRSATITINDNNNGVAGSTQAIPLNGTGQTPGNPAASLNPTSLTFAAQTVGTTSASQTITVTNTGGANLVLGATPVMITGTNPGDFANAAGTACTANLSIAPNGSCIVNVAFMPTATGSRSATLTITDNSGGVAGSTQAASLSGNGVAAAPPIAQLNPTALTFAGQTVNTTSAPQSVTVTNTGGTNLVLGAPPVGISGTNAGDFAGTAGTTCTANLSIAPNGSCIVNVAFMPTAAGTRSATLTFTDNSGGTPGSTQQVTLSGTGNPAPPTANLSANTVAFGTQGVGAPSPSQTITVTNTGGANLVLGATNSITITGTNAGDFSLSAGTTCTNGASVPGSGGTCVIILIFTPGAIGARGPATVTITDNANPPTQTITLTGTGIDFMLTVQSASQTVPAGSPAMYTINIEPGANGFANAVSFNASGAPSATTVTFTPPSLTPNGQPMSTVLKITTTKNGAALPRAPLGRPWLRILQRMFLQPILMLWIAVILMAMLAARFAHEKQWARRYTVVLPLILLVASGVMLGGCSSATPSGGTPRGTYTITVTASSGSLQHVTKLTLTVD